MLASSNQPSYERTASTEDETPDRESTATKRNDAFPFFKLPSELRNRIYDLAIVQEKLIDLTDTNRHRARTRSQSSSLSSYQISNSTDREHKALVAQPPLTRVCKEIRAETLSMFYGENTFLAELGAEGSYQTEATTGWLSGIGSANRRLLRQLYLDGENIFIEGVLNDFTAEKIALTSVKPEGKLTEKGARFEQSDLEDEEGEEDEMDLEEDEHENENENENGVGKEKRCFKLAFEAL